MFLSTRSVERDHQRWYQKGVIDYEYDINIFKKFILERWAWVDGHICDGGLVTKHNEGFDIDISGDVQRVDNCY